MKVVLYNNDLTNFSKKNSKDPQIQKSLLLHHHSQIETNFLSSKFFDNFLLQP